MNLVVWAGPITEKNLSGAVLPPNTRIVTVNRGVGGHGSSHFAALGKKFGSLRALLASRGLDLDQFGTVTLAGFSAAHGLFEILLRDPESRGRVDALAAFDAYYVGHEQGPKPGYQAFAELAAEGRRLAVFTTSNGTDGSHPSASASVRPLLAPFELRAAQRPDVLPAGAAVMARGGLVWLDYGSTLSHAEHATRLGPLVMTHVVTPYLQRRGEQAPTEDTAWALASLGLLLWGLS